jgi:PKHD-type hydroxylase
MYNLYVEDFLTNSECEELINGIKQTELKPMSSSKIVNGVLIDEAVNEYTNKRKGTYITGPTIGDIKYQSLTKKLISFVNNEKIFNGVEYIGISKYTFNQYGKGDFLDWHKDSHEIMYGATLTIIIQLNDDYDGGEVEYTINDKVYKLPKKRGSIFLFDPNIDHSVSKIEEGTRYSINAWPNKKINKVLI